MAGKNPSGEINKTQLTYGNDLCESIMTRDFNAPRTHVFQAWTEPQKAAQWWGPRGFTNPVCEMDPRPGGQWRIVMRSPEGAEYPIKGEVREVVAPARLVIAENWEEHPDDWIDALKKSLPEGEIMKSQEALNTITFEEHDGKTTLTVRTRFESPAVCQAMVNMGMAEGWGQSFERLDELLANA